MKALLVVLILAADGLLVALLLLRPPPHTEIIRPAPPASTPAVPAPIAAAEEPEGTPEKAERDRLDRAESDPSTLGASSSDAVRELQQERAGLFTRMAQEMEEARSLFPEGTDALENALRSIEDRLAPEIARNAEAIERARNERSPK